MSTATASRWDGVEGLTPGVVINDDPDHPVTVTDIFIYEPTSTSNGSVVVIGAMSTSDGTQIVRSVTPAGSPIMGQWRWEAADDPYRWKAVRIFHGNADRHLSLADTQR